MNKTRSPFVRIQRTSANHWQLRENLPNVVPELLNPEYFMTMKAELGVLDEMMTFVGPAIKYENTKLFYDRGSCLRGTEKAEWPAEVDFS